MKQIKLILFRDNSPPFQLYLSFKPKTIIMKSFILLSFAFLLTSYSFAQLDKGTFLLGGNGSFYKYDGKFNAVNNNNTSKATDIKINASVGYFLIDKFVLGLRPSFSFMKAKQDGTGATFGSVTQFIVGPFSRYYFLEKDKPFNILLDAAYLFGTNSYPFDNTGKGVINELSISAGLEAFFNTTVGVEFLVGYKSKYEDIKGIAGYSDKKNGLNVSIGFQIHLSK